MQIWQTETTDGSARITYNVEIDMFEVEHVETWWQPYEIIGSTVNVLILVILGFRIFDWVVDLPV